MVDPYCLILGVVFSAPLHLFDMYATTALVLFSGYLFICLCSCVFLYFCSFPPFVSFISTIVFVFRLMVVLFQNMCRVRSLVSGLGRDKSYNALFRE